MSEFTTLALSDVALHAVIRGRGPLVMLVHGFPGSRYSWRHQMGPITDAGFTACAIDVRGYGGSDKPTAIEAYAMEKIVADIAKVVERLGPYASAILIGHDWGSPMVWNTALIRPDRVRAIAGLSAPYLGTPRRSFKEFFEDLFTRRGKFFYQSYFQAPGIAEREIEADPRNFLRRFYYAVSGRRPGRKLADGQARRRPPPR
jgi:pimeloyl-ACP methyl ester carboxylesterase